MNSKSKTTEDILREMREYADQLDNDGDCTGADFRDFANQIEQAIARDTICLSDGSLIVVRSAEIRTRLAQLDAEYVGYKNAVVIIAVLNKVHDYLGKLVRDNLVKDTPEASDLADDVWDAIHACPKGSAADLNNAAAIHEAFEDILKDCAQSRRWERASTKEHYIDSIERLARAALAAPPRNCDRFNSGDVNRDAQAAMEAMLDEGVAGIRSIAEYLLAPAKGGAE